MKLHVISDKRPTKKKENTPWNKTAYTAKSATGKEFSMLILTNNPFILLPFLIVAHVKTQPAIYGCGERAALMVLLLLLLLNGHSVAIYVVQIVVYFKKEHMTRWRDDENRYVPLSKNSCTTTPGSMRRISYTLWNITIVHIEF